MSNQILVGSNFTAYKNRIINGDFQVNQRLISGLTDNKGYTFDRVFQQIDSGQIEVGTFQAYSIDLNSTDPFGDGSLVNGYHLDKNILDYVGNNNGSLTNEKYDVGKFGYAAVLERDNHIGLNTLSIVKQNTFTYSMWLNANYFDSSSDIDQVLLGDWDSSDKNIIFSLKEKTKLNFVSGNGSDQNEDFYSDAGLELNKWYNIILVRDGTNTKIYINGELFTQFTAKYAPSNTDNEVRIGSDISGLIDQIQFFNRVLTDDEIKEVYYQTARVLQKYTLNVNIKTPIDLSGTNSFIPYEYRFEGQHLIDLALDKKKVTVSFEFQSSNNGKYSISLSNKDEETIIKTFSYWSSGAMQDIVVTFDLSEFTTKPEVNENLGYILRIASMNNGDYSVDSEGIYEKKVYTVSDCVLFSDDTNWLGIKDVQLEEGEFATEFERLPYEVQLDRCLRYYETMTSNGSITALRAYKVSSDGSTADDYWQFRYNFKKIKRTIPIILSVFGTTSPYYNPDRLDKNIIEFTNNSDNNGGFDLISLNLDAEIY